MPKKCHSLSALFPWCGGAACNCHFHDIKSQELTVSPTLQGSKAGEESRHGMDWDARVGRDILLYVACLTSTRKERGSPLLDV